MPPQLPLLGVDSIHTAFALFAATLAAGLSASARERKERVTHVSRRSMTVLPQTLEREVTGGSLDVKRKATFVRSQPSSSSSARESECESEGGREGGSSHAKEMTKEATEEGEIGKQHQQSRRRDDR